MDRLNALIAQLKPHLIRAFWFALALIFLVESWLWDNVKQWLRRLGLALGLERFDQWLAGVVAGLSPQKTLAVFALPLVAVLPLKILALSMLAHGQIVAGIGFIFLIKTLMLGVEAFLFDLCREKLLEMAWFGQFYSMVLDVRAWASRLVWPYRERLLQSARRLREYILSKMGAHGAGFARRIAKLRELARPKSSA
jgi:hypothetical protein